MGEPPSGFEPPFPAPLFDPIRVPFELAPIMHSTTTSSREVQDRHDATSPLNPCLTKAPRTDILKMSPPECQRWHAWRVRRRATNVDSFARDRALPAPRSALHDGSLQSWPPRHAPEPSQSLRRQRWAIAKRRGRKSTTRLTPKRRSPWVGRVGSQGNGRGRKRGCAHAYGVRAARET